MNRLVVVSGLSGSGKTLAVKALEDMGYFAVDNLPIPLILPFMDLLDRGEDGQARGAFVVDVREREHLVSLPGLIDALRERRGFVVTVLFFEASDQTLSRRFQASRRPHPLAQSGRATLAEAIQRERELLVGLRALADQVIETDDLSPHDLRRLLKQALREEVEKTQLQCHVVTFGFKYGGPREADMMFDVRFLQNPYFDNALKPQSGLDADVVKFLESKSEYVEFMRRLEDLLSFVMPRFVHEGKSYLTIAIGCTGGRHRSVAIGERVARLLESLGYPTAVTHRDLTLEAERESG